MDVKMTTHRPVPDRIGAACVLALVLLAARAPGRKQAAAPTTHAKPPEARGYTQLVYHPPSGRVIMFGGESNHRTALEDTWAYDTRGDVWSEIGSGPHPENAEGRTAAWDAESDRIIVHFTTRLDRSAERGLVRISETWAFDPATGTWTDMRPDPAPFGLMGARMVYDAAADRMILFGGADFTQDASPRFNETWAYDFNTNTWTRRTPSGPPPGRTYFGMAYDEDARKVLIFGGSLAPEDSAAAGELWAYDWAADRWERIPYTGDAHPDHHPSMVYAPALGRTLYMAGESLDAFDWTTRSWTPLAYDARLGVRHFAGMAWDEAGARLVVFGGGDRGLHYDDRTWIYAPSSDTWLPGAAAR